MSQAGLNATAATHPFAAAQVGGAFNTAVRTQAGLNVAAYQHPFAAYAGYRMGAGAGMNRGMGYGSMMNRGMGGGMGRGYSSLMNRGMGGYGMTGGLLNGGGYGGGYGGLGFATQWMLNPYSGYLSGAASVTNANAQYWSTIQTAKLTREEARRSAIQTRRAMIEEAEYERADMPDPEKIRREQLQREIDHARNSPNLTEIWSGKSLNVLMRNLITQQGLGVKGPNVALSEDTLKSINLTAGDTRGNVGLIKEQGNLQWPQSLQAEMFKVAARRPDPASEAGRRYGQRRQQDARSEHDQRSRRRPEKAQRHAGRQRERSVAGPVR